MIKKILLRERESLNVQIDKLKRQLEYLPKEKLICAKNGSYTKWYKSDGTIPKYISKKEREYAEKLAVKKLYSIQLEELQMRVKEIDQIMKCIEKNVTVSSEILAHTEGYEELLNSYFNKYPNDVQKWLQEEYEHNLSHSENLIHETYSGQYVRSKSEVIIANTLYHHKIPFRYECELNMNNIKFYPDFTILHPKTKQIIYWEHFGMMDDASYRDNVYNKMKIFGNYGIIPSINLITTYETKKNPINSYKIERIVEENFAQLFLD